MSDLYQALGVSRNATKDDIKKAYRKLAKEHHPDRNPGNKKSEELFKKIAFAHDVLTDDKRRQAYDRFGDAALKEGFNADAYERYQNQYNTGSRGGFAGFDPRDFQSAQWEVNLEDLFGGGLGDIFGGQSSRRGRRGQPGSSGSRPLKDVAVDVSVSFEEAASGVEKELSFHEPGIGARVKSWVGGKKPIKFRIPPGVRDGEKVRLKGQGAKVTGRQDSGDIVVTVHVNPHPLFTRVGDDVHLTLPLTVSEAWFGASIDVPTLWGNVKLKVAPKTSSGAKLRVKGKGINRPGGVQGDLIVHTQVKLPTHQGSEVDDWARQAERMYPDFNRFSRG